MYLGSKIKRVGDVDKYFLGIDETLTSVAGINILWETSTNIKYSGIFIEVSWTFIRPKKGRNKNQISLVNWLTSTQFNFSHFYLVPR